MSISCCSEDLLPKGKDTGMALEMVMEMVMEMGQSAYFVCRPRAHMLPKERLDINIFQQFINLYN